MMNTEEILPEHSLFSSELSHFARRFMIDTAAETERLCELRRHKVFFGDLFRPTRRVLFGKIEDSVSAFSAEPTESPIVFLPQMRRLPKTDNGSSSFFVGAIAGQIPTLQSLLAAAAMGFDGVCLEVGDGDKALLQYLTEVCREVKLSPIWMVRTAEELARVLETDAPYVGLFFENRPPQSQSESPIFSVPFDPCVDLKIRKSIPSEVVTLCLFSANGPDSESFLHRIAGQRFDAYVDVSLGQC
jgi:hypothetical protein